MSTGLKISKSGFDVSDASNDNLIYSSEFNTPKVYLSGSTDVSVGTGTNTYTVVTHNLGYIPAYSAYVESPASGSKMWGAGGLEPSTLSPSDPHDWACKADTTTLKLVINATNAGTHKVSYFIYADPAKQTALSPTESGVYGLKISNTGSDVTSTDLSDFSVNTDYELMSIVKVVTLTLTNTSNSSTTVNHNLDYRPAWSGRVESGSTFYQVPYDQFGVFNHDVWVTDTVVGARILTIAPPATYTFKVALFNKAI